MSNKIKVVVTGGAGFIGSNLVDALISENFDVHVIDNLSGGKKENVNEKAKLHILDMTKLDSIIPVFKGAKYVFHLAALWLFECVHQPRSAVEINIVGTYNVIEAAHQAGIKKLCFSSSASVYGNALATPMT